MKKQLLLCLFLLAGAGILRAQTNLYFTNFDSYTAGGYAALQAGAPWTTWSAAPGTAEDATISTTHAYSGTNSAYVINNNDFVLNLYDKTTGRYMVEWRMFVDSGKLGYFNFLSDFTGSTSKWAIQGEIYHDSIFVDADGASKAKVPYAMNTWTHMQLIVDLDDDFATYYIDGVEIVSYKWSKGAQGTDNSLKLDAIDFFGWDGTGSPVTGASGYYLDDISVDSVLAPESPLNLVAVQNAADIDVSWTAPSGTPELYKLMRNGSVVNSTTGLAYTDPGPWPNTYIYSVRARYAGEGYSHSSNTDTVIIAGGYERNLVLMEGGTGTWCGYCPGAAMGLRELIETNAKDATAIEYHSGDTYENTATTARLNYYNIQSFPTVIADGQLYAVGGNATTSMYPTYLPMYNARITVPAIQIQNIDIVQTGVDTYTATITVTQTYPYDVTGWKLRTALTESNIPETWGNQTEVDFACRAMYPDANGTTLDFSSQTTQTVTLNFTTTGYIKNNCEFVAFIQYDATKEVTQTSKIDMSSILGIEELQSQKISIYPNPANTYMMLLSSGKGNLDIYDMTGKLAYSSIIFNTKQVIDVSKFTKGVYFVKVSNSNSNFTQKLVIE
jgi:hypothetical protein